MTWLYKIRDILYGRWSEDVEGGGGCREEIVGVYRFAEYVVLEIKRVRNSLA